MSYDQTVQNFANHRRRPPPAFMLALVVLLMELLHRIIVFVRHPGVDHGWELMVALALVIVGAYARRNAQIVQDRVIRDEMVMRLQRLLPAERQGEIARISLPQLVALRFASDAELPGLVGEVSGGALSDATQIKRKIVDWQADWLRV